MAGWRAKGRLAKIAGLRKMTHNRPVDQTIAACGGDAREAVKALIVANHYLETDLEKLKAAASMGYARGKLLPRDRKGLV